MVLCLLNEEFATSLASIPYLSFMPQRLKDLQGTGYKIEHKLKIKLEGHNDKFEKYNGKCNLVTDDEILYGYRLSNLCFDFQNRYAYVFA